jgi:hypothetical protein
MGLSTKPNPPVRADGRCYVCKKPRRDPVKGTLIPQLAQMLAEDPFCTEACAKTFHGQPVTKGREKEAETEEAVA